VRSSSDHILASHADSLPQPDEHLFQQKLRAAVGDVVPHRPRVT
jgi:hypothetical protein